MTSHSNLNNDDEHHDGYLWAECQIMMLLLQQAVLLKSNSSRPGGGGSLGRRWQSCLRLKLDSIFGDKQHAQADH